jgi:hypothetical protein
MAARHWSFLAGGGASEAGFKGSRSDYQNFASKLPRCAWPSYRRGLAKGGLLTCFYYHSQLEEVVITIISSGMPVPTGNYNYSIPSDRTLGCAS